MRPMRLIRSFIVLVFLSATPVLNADVTIRYKMDFKLGSFVPPAAQQQLSNQKLPFPLVMVMQIKGDKGYSNVGLAASLLDFTKQQITVLDSTHKLFATVYMKDFPGELGANMTALPAMPPAAQKILDSVTSNFSARKTGRTDTILGVQVEENELTLTIELPVPADLPLPPGMLKPGEIVTVMKMVMQIWTATPSEVLRVPALNEFDAHMAAMRLMSPFGWIQQMLGRLPGFAKGSAPMLDYFSKSTTPMLKAQSEIYVPVMSRIAQLLQAQGKQPPTGLDGNAPLVETNTEVIEISGAALDDSIFQVPADYQATSLPDLFKTLMPAPSAPKPPTTSIPIAP
jgi:hypothetical protein